MVAVVEMRSVLRALMLALVVVAVAGCAGLRLSVHAPPESPYKARTAEVAGDDLDLASLRRAAHASLAYYDALPTDSVGRHGVYKLGHDLYGRQELRASVAKFLEIIESTPRAKVHANLREQCRTYIPTSRPRFTAYYEPLIGAAYEPDEKHRFPVYASPAELTTVHLAKFFKGDRRAIHGRVEDGEMEPYLTRRQIDGEGRLHGRGLELAWLSDPVDLFFLHIQGSGRLSMTDGKVLRVNFATSNGLPYTSVGRDMLDRGYLPPNKGSSGDIKHYLSANPELQNDLMFRNERYIFFRQVDLAPDQGPLGSLGVPLVSGRSLATDRRYVPPGVVTYLTTERPLVSDDGKLEAWQSFSRFAFSHDSGFAIKGPARVDLYWGEGEAAGREAGYVNGAGELAILLCGVQPRRRVEVGSMAAYTPVEFSTWSSATALAPQPAAIVAGQAGM